MTTFHIPVTVRNARCGIYRIRHIATGKFYIGSSINIGRRWAEHVTALNAGTHSNGNLQRDWTRYGRDAFAFEVVEECHPHRRLEREQQYLDTWRPFYPRGYNVLRQADAHQRRAPRQSNLVRAAIRRLVRNI